jgi:hypothetical protein
MRHCMKPNSLYARVFQIYTRFGGIGIRFRNAVSKLNKAIDSQRGNSFREAGRSSLALTLTLALTLVSLN